LVRTGAFSVESGAEAMRDNPAESDICSTAVFAASAVIAIGELIELQEASLRVPEDVALVGFDDIPLAAYIDPQLTTVHLPAFGLGWGAGKMLMDLLHRAHELENTQCLLDTWLIVRRSCGASRSGRVP